jgi:hypothetical protein
VTWFEEVYILVGFDKKCALTNGVLIIVLNDIKNITDENIIVYWQYHK